MNNLIQAAADARRLLKGFAGIAAVADAFEDVGKLQQAKGEAEAALDVLRNQFAEVQAEILLAKDSANSYVMRTEAYVNELTVAAEFEAKKLVDEARAEAEKLCSAALEQIRVSDASVAAAMDRVQALEIDLVAKRREFDELDGKIAALREQAARVLG